jgi:dihydrofolate synthase / folylpolyglutamate synthase
MMMNYDDCVAWIFEKLPMYQRVGAPAYKADLNNTFTLMQMTGNPHLGLKCIHVAGTNGKGSVSHMLASILQETGLKTGLYTSPHLFDFRERMRINGNMIPKKFIIGFIHKYKDEIESVQPSFFEISVALAFTWFRHEKTDIAVIETGMGGRLDSTNVITPVLSVITNIGLDHTMFLGNTKEKIATEKAGIIKPDIPVILGETDSETLDIFNKTAKLNHAILKRADKHLFFMRNTAITNCIMGQVLRKGQQFIKNIECPLAGDYQEKNILTVVSAARRLKKQGYEIRKRHIRDGIRNVKRNTRLAGRWEQISEAPVVICDVAHNREGLELVFRQLLTMKHRKLHMVIGVSNDKDLQDLFSLLPSGAVYYFCRANVPRAMDENLLAAEAKKRDMNFSVFHTVESAYHAALLNADPESDVIFCGGSTFVVAEIPQLKQKQNDKD